MPYPSSQLKLPDPPQDFSLETNYEEVTGFIQQLKSISLTDDFDALAKLRKYKGFRPGLQKFTKPKVNRHTDFSKIKTIGTAAALMLAAEYDRFRRLQNKRVVFIDVNNWDPSVRSMLSELGLFELYGEPTPEPSHASNDVVFKMVSDKKAKGGLATELREKVEAAIEQLHSASLTVPEKLALRDGLVEAMTNVSHHAYPPQNQYTFKCPPVRGAWWMAGSISKTKREATVVFYDQGISIPGHFTMSPSKNRMTKYLEKLHGLTGRIFDSKHDGKVIEAAVLADATSTGEKGRGQGLSDIKSFVDRFGRGRLRILSRNGEYLYSAGGSTTTKSHRSSVGGTLIEWRVEF